MLSAATTEVSLARPAPTVADDSLGWGYSAALAVATYHSVLPVFRNSATALQFIKVWPDANLTTVMGVRHFSLRPWHALPCQWQWQPSEFN